MATTRLLIAYVLFSLCCCKHQHCAPSVLSAVSYGATKCHSAESTHDGKLCRTIAASVVHLPTPPPTSKPHIEATIAIIFAMNYSPPNSAKPDKCVGMCEFGGTGVVIGPGLILTAKHVVEDAEYITATLPARDDAGKLTGVQTRRISMRVRQDGEPDYAILTVNHKEDLSLFPTPAKLAYGWSPEQGMVVWHFGKTTGPQKGVVLASSTGCARPHRKIPLDIKIDFGDSGGPIFFGDAVVGYVIKLNEVVCQASIDSMLTAIGYDP